MTFRIMVQGRKSNVLWWKMCLVVGFKNTIQTTWRYTSSMERWVRENGGKMEAAKVKNG